MTLEIDPTQVRGFSDDVMLELNEVIRPWITRIRGLMADGDGEANYHTLGRDASEGDYGGRVLGFALAGNIGDGMRYLEQLETGLEALSLASAVFAERLVDSDGDNAVDMKKIGPPPPGEYY